MPLQLLNLGIPLDALEADGVQPPSRMHRAPRGVVRGLGAPGAAPAPTPAASDSTPAPPSGDALADDLARMNLGRGGGGGGGGGGGDDGEGGDGGGGAPGGKKPAQGVDWSRPEVQVRSRGGVLDRLRALRRPPQYTEQHSGPEAKLQG